MDWCDVVFEMFQVHSDKSKKLLTMSFSQHVKADDMKQCLAETRDLLVDMKLGFRLLTDLSGLELMEPSCAIYLGEIMKLCDESKVSAVVRVVPDPKKDIGFDILSIFHYGPNVETVTYENPADALQSLVA